MNEHYLGVCIPYRDNGDGVRKKHLDTLVPYLTKFLNDRNIKHKFFIGHQVDDKLFNRSGTKNAAFLAALVPDSFSIVGSLGNCFSLPEASIFSNNFR